MSAATDTYKSWLAERQAVRAENDPAEFLHWMLVHPSPMLSDGIFSTGAEVPPSPAKVRHTAIYDTVASFAGTKVRVDVTDTPEASSRMLWQLQGEMVGLGSLIGEPNGTPRSDTDLVLVRTEHGQIVSARLSHVVGIEAF